MVRPWPPHRAVSRAWPIAALSRQEIIWDVTITPVAVPTLDATVEQLRNYDDSSKARRVYAPEQLWKYLGRVTYARAAHSKRQLYEVMVDFWGDHFNVDFRGQWLRYWEDANVIRPYALLFHTDAAATGCLQCTSCIQNVKVAVFWCALFE